MRSGSSAPMGITGCNGLVGVRRSGFSSAAHDLQELGLISYQRGHIEMIEGVSPERRACERLYLLYPGYATFLAAAARSRS